MLLTLARDFGIVFLPAELTTGSNVVSAFGLRLFCDTRNGLAWIVMFVSWCLLSCAIIGESATKLFFIFIHKKVFFVL